MTEDQSLSKNRMSLSLSDEFLRKAFARDPWLGAALACFACDTSLKSIVLERTNGALTDFVGNAETYREHWQKVVLPALIKQGLGGKAPDEQEILRDYALDNLLPAIEGQSFLDALFAIRGLLRHGRRPYPSQDKSFEPYHRSAVCTFELFLAGRHIVEDFVEQFSPRARSIRDPLLKKETLQLDAADICRDFLSFSENDPACAFACAAILFERTMTLALQKLNVKTDHPSAVDINTSHGLTALRDLWKSLIINQPSARELPEVIGNSCWDALVGFIGGQGNSLLHGGTNRPGGRPTAQGLQKATCNLILASQRVTEEMERLNLSIYQRVVRHVPERYLSEAHQSNEAHP